MSEKETAFLPLLSSHSSTFLAASWQRLGSSLQDIKCSSRLCTPSNP